MDERAVIGLVHWQSVVVGRNAQKVCSTFTDEWLVMAQERQVQTAGLERGDVGRAAAWHVATRLHDAGVAVPLLPDGKLRFHDSGSDGFWETTGEHPRFRLDLTSVLEAG